MRDVRESALSNLLVVDDEPSIRITMVQMLTDIGYFVRSAEDGFSALLEIRKSTPDLILSDLNMPGMSGFELLSVVRHRFPSIRVIAMSDSSSDHEVPFGLAADAFYRKGSDTCSLLKLFEGLPRPEWLPGDKPTTFAPLWFQRHRSYASGEPYVAINCPECLRTFQQSVGGALSTIREAHCIHCASTVYYAIAEPVDWSPELEHQRMRGAGHRTSRHDSANSGLPRNLLQAPSNIAIAQQFQFAANYISSHKWRIHESCHSCGHFAHSCRRRRFRHGRNQF
jgi:CheY-like chemotaxis protein